MPRKSSDYQIEIPVRIRDETKAGAKSSNTSVDKMAQQAIRDVERQMSAADSLQRQRSQALINQWNRDEAAKTRILQNAIRDRERLERGRQSSTDSLQRQRSAALLSQWNRDEAVKTKAAQQALRDREKAEQAALRASESLQKQRSSALIAQWNREQREFAKSESAKVQAAKQAAADIEASQDAMWTRIRNIALVGVAAIVLIIAGLGQAIDRAASFQRLEQGLASIMGSAALATKEITELKEVAKVPGLGFREAIQGSLQLQALGVEADRARKIIEGFGNAVAFTGGKSELDRILLQLTQMMSAGKVIMQDLRPIIQTAPIAGRALRDVFGTIEPKKLEQMTGNIDEFVDKWVAGLQRLPKAPNAAANSFENLGDTWDRFLISIGKPFLPVVSEALSLLTMILEKTGMGLETVLTILLRYPGVLAIATTSVTIFGTALLFASTNAIPLIIAGISSAIQFFISFAATLRLVGQVMVGTASLIQGAAATTVVAAGGWIALAVAVGGLIYWLTRQKDIQEQVNRITVDQIETEGQAIKSSQDLMKTIKDTVIAQDDSTKKHEALNAILVQLDPTTRAYIEALINEEQQVKALNAELQKNIDLNKTILQAQLVTSSTGILQQLNEQKILQDVVEGFNVRIREQQKLLENASPERAVAIRQEILGLASAVNEYGDKLKDVNQKLTDNQVKFLASAKALGLNRNEVEQLLVSWGVTGNRLTTLVQVYDRLTATTNKTSESLRSQADAIREVKRELDSLLATGTAEIDSKILDIVKTARTEEEARAMAQAALKGEQRYFGGRFGGTGTDTRLSQLIEERKRIQAVEKAAREVLEPKPATKSSVDKAANDREMIRSMKTVADELAAEFQEEFGRAMKFRFGQTPLHDKLNYRHEAAFDISEDVRTKEGKFIMDWLSSQGITARASLGREVSKTTGKLISTGTHIHAGEMSGPLGRALKVNENLLSPKGLETELAKQKLVFAPWLGQMISQSDYNLQRSQIHKAGMQLSTTGDMISQQEAEKQPEPILAQLPLELERKWENFYSEINRQERELRDRRKDFGEEHKANQSAITTELGHLELDLMHLKRQAADDQFSEQRRLLSAKREEVDLTRAISEAQDELANGPLNQSLRIQLALLEDINDIRSRDEQAIKDYNRAQLEMADATVYHSQQADTAVANFLASQKSVTEIVSDAKIGVMQTTFDLMDRGLAKITDKLGIMKDLVHDILSGFLRLALSQFFKSVFLPQNGGGGGIFGGGGQGSGGSAGNFFTNLIGSIFRPGGGVTAAGGGGGGGITNPTQGGAAAIANIFNGGAIFPSTISSQAGTPVVGGLLSQGGLTNIISSSGLGQKASLKNLLGGGMAPLLGITLGASLGAGIGGQSKLGNILGGVGGGLLGGAAGLGLLGLLGGGGIAGGSLGGAAAGAIGGGGILGSATALLTNPFTIAIGAGLLVGAFFLGKKKQRQKEESARDQLKNDIFSQLDGLLEEVKGAQGQISPILARNQAQALVDDYYRQVAQFKTSSVRKSAENFRPFFNAKVQAIYNAASTKQEASKNLARIVPEFDTGGGVWTAFSGKVPTSATRGVTIKVHGDEAVLNPAHIARLPEGSMTLARAGVPGFQSTSRVSSEDRNSGGEKDGDIIIDVQSIKIDANSIVFEGMKSSTNQRVYLRSNKAIQYSRQG